MKLNYKRTILVGFAFFLISAFWQAYDKTVPMLMTYKFGMTQTGSGIVMALDNVLAVFLLPLFGALSDKNTSKFGKRTPFIFIGTICAVISFIFIPLIGSLWLFIAVLLVTLISMAFFRSPAVALMPDVTCKPLRSKGNAVINLMGTAGGLLILAVGLFIKVGEKNMGNFFPYYIVVCGIMLLGLIAFLLTVKEKKWAQDMEDDTVRFGLEEPTKNDEPAESRSLSKAEFKSLLLILASVALWYIGYNSITSKYSVYASNILGFDFNMTLIIAQAAAIVSYIPVGNLASKIGRRKTILGGVALLAACFLLGFIVTANATAITAPMYLLFVLVGLAWAAINVNSLPMVVEMCKGSEVGKFTGYYYTFSMAAQVVTPILAGTLLKTVGYKILFPYAAFFVACSFVTMLMVKHGDSKVEAKKGLEAFDTDD